MTSKQKDKMDRILTKDSFLIIVLDACRYDYFEDVYEDYIENEPEKVWSPASTTDVWLPEIFDKEYYDLLYITANPYINKHNFKFGSKFKEVKEVWDYGWNERERTVLPSTLSKEVLRNLSSDKIIAHYIQPHTPYLGHMGQSWIHARRHVLEGSPRKDNRPLDDGITLEEAYIENLRKVLSSVVSYIPLIDRDIIITADHGETLPEGSNKGEHVKRETPVLREVPWCIIGK